MRASNQCPRFARKSPTVSLLKNHAETKGNKHARTGIVHGTIWKDLAGMCIAYNAYDCEAPKFR